MSTARFILWIAPAFSQIWLAVIIWKRKLHRVLPLFFAYVVLHVLRTGVFLMMNTKSWAYFYAFHIANLADVLLELGIIYALFNQLVSCYRSVRKIGEVLFWFAGGLAFILACVNASSGVNEGAMVMTVSLGMERGVRMIESGLLLFIFLFAVILRLSWRNYVLGIAVGFCLLLTGQLVLFTARLRFGDVSHQSFDMLNAAAYNLAVIVWLVYAYQTRTVNMFVHGINAGAIRVWDETLSEYLHQ